MWKCPAEVGASGHPLQSIKTNRDFFFFFFKEREYEKKEVLLKVGLVIIVRGSGSSWFNAGDFCSI